MGRRALNKVGPDAELASHFLPSLEAISKPFQSADLFGREAPLEVEIGSGKGMFLESVAASVPERDFLGIEVSAKYSRFAASKLAVANLDNARMIHGDALELLSDYLPDASVAAVHVYFPDPWWKQRHRKRRVMNAACVKDIERVLKPGGSLHFWTDVKEYFDKTMKLVPAESRLSGPFDPEAPELRSDSPWRTHFDRRMHLNDEPVYRSEFRKEA